MGKIGKCVIEKFKSVSSRFKNKNKMSKKSFLITRCGKKYFNL